MAAAAAKAAAADGGGKFVNGPLEEPKLRNLMKHKYSVVGTSLCEPLLQKLWCWLIQFVPLTAAPNAITLTGLVINISSSALVMFYNPDARQPISSWLCIYSAISLFIYQTLDALDGKQARRTGSASPLGELFDHGCDAASTLFVALGAGCAIGMGHYPMLFMAQVIISMTLFYVAHWIAYITGEVKFGKVDVTEAQLTIMAMYIVTAYIGSDNLWHLQLFGLQLRCWQFIAFCITSSSMPLRLLTSIANGGIGKNGSTVANTSIIFPGIVWAPVPLLTLIVAGKSPDLYAQQPCLFLFTFGMVGVKFCERLIVAHMSKSELLFWDTALLSPAVLALNQYCNYPINELIVLIVAAIIASIDVCIYSIQLCEQIAAYCGIRVLTITAKA